MLVYVLPNLYIRGGAESTGTLPVTPQSPFGAEARRSWTDLPRQFTFPYFPTRNALMRQYVVLSGMGIEYCFPQIAFQ